MISVLLISCFALVPVTNSEIINLDQSLKENAALEVPSSNHQGRCKSFNWVMSGDIVNDIVSVPQFSRCSVLCVSPTSSAYRIRINSTVRVLQDGSALITEVILQDHVLTD